MFPYVTSSAGKAVHVSQGASLSTHEHNKTRLELTVIQDQNPNLRDVKAVVGVCLVDKLTDGLLHVPLLRCP